MIKRGTAYATLAEAQRRLQDRGHRVACIHPDTWSLFVSEQRDQRDQAIALCSVCPIQVECLAAAEARHEVSRSVIAGQTWFPTEVVIHLPIGDLTSWRASRSRLKGAL